MKFELPSDWSIRELQTLVKKDSRITYGIVQTGEPVKNGIPCVRVVDLVSNNLSVADMITTSPEISDSYKRTILQKSDLMFALRGEIGCVAKVTKELVGANLTRGVALISPGKNVAPDYLLWALRSEMVRIDIMKRVNGSALREIPILGLRRVKIPLPPLPEQRKIAGILGTWDEAIALAERRIEAARQRKKGLMQRLLTGRVRFPEFEGEEWREIRLGSVFTERKERGYEDLPLLSVTADEGIIYRDELDRRDTSSADKSKYLRVCKGDIAYNTMRMWQGRSGVSRLEGIVSPAYTVCKPKSSIDSDFMGYLFQLPSVVYLFRRYSQGMVSDTWNLKFNHFAHIHIRIPEIREQRRIAAVLQACDREIELLTQKRDALQRQKKGLMQRLLTGQVRV